MMQTLLEERFKLKIHKETRELPVYELTAARGGPRLSVTREGTCVLADADHPLPIPPPPRVCGQIIGSNSGLDGHGVSMNSLCEVLSELLNQDVIDKTGIAGIFDIHFDIDMESMRAEVAREALKARPDQGERDEPGLTDNIWRSVFLSPFQSQMQKVGLKLQQAKAPGEFLVIDYIERPSGN
jgi:uncharacterized protein (TIGR03435 family)